MYESCLMMTALYNRMPQNGRTMSRKECIRWHECVLQQDAKWGIYVRDIAIQDDINGIDPKCLLAGASSGSLLLARCLTAGHSLLLSKIVAHSHGVVSIRLFHPSVSDP